MENGIVHVRVDDRMVHGLVANYWLAYYKSSRVMVLNEPASTDEMMRASLKMATPAGVNLSVLAPSKAIANIQAGNYVGQRVFIVYVDVAGVYALFKSGVAIKEINLGNVTQNITETTTLNKTVRVNNEEKAQLKEMKDAGIKVYCRFTVEDTEAVLVSILDS